MDSFFHSPPQQALAAENERHKQLEEQFKYRVGAFVKRESLARKTVEALERKLQGPLGYGGALASGSSPKMID